MNFVFCEQIYIWTNNRKYVEQEEISSKENLKYPTLASLKYLRLSQSQGKIGQNPY